MLGVSRFTAIFEAITECISLQDGMELRGY
jgi:hypothetical protein